eukprot:3752004-Rhodomonas_salina.4
MVLPGAYARGGTGGGARRSTAKGQLRYHLRPSCATDRVVTDVAYAATLTQGKGGGGGQSVHRSVRCYAPRRTEVWYGNRRGGRRRKRCTRRRSRSVPLAAATGTAPTSICTAPHCTGRSFVLRNTVLGGDLCCWAEICTASPCVVPVALYWSGGAGSEEGCGLVQQEYDTAGEA